MRVLSASGFLGTAGRSWVWVMKNILFIIVLCLGKCLSAQVGIYDELNFEKNNYTHQQTFINFIINNQVSIQNFKEALNLEGNTYQMPGLMVVVPANGGVVNVYAGLKTRYDNVTDLSAQELSYAQQHTEMQLLYHAKQQDQEGLILGNVVYMYTVEPPCFLDGKDNGYRNCLTQLQNQVNNNTNLKIIAFFSAPCGINERKNIIPTTIVDNNDKWGGFFTVVRGMEEDQKTNFLNMLKLKIRTIPNTWTVIDTCIALFDDHIDAVNDVDKKERTTILAIFNQWLRNKIINKTEGELITRIYNALYSQNRLSFLYIHK